MLKFIANSHIDPEIGANAFIISSLKYSSPMHFHDFFEFFLITEGRCIHKVNNFEQSLCKGALVFIRPEDFHCYEYDGKADCEFINIPCRREIIEETFSYFGNATYINQLINSEQPFFTILSPLEIADFVKRYEKFSMLSTIDKPQAKIQLRSLLIEILTQYFFGNKALDKKNIPLWLEVLLIEMQKSENYVVGIEKMYELSGKSVGHLNRVFKQYLNTTPINYINQLRLNLAKTLLLNSNLSILEVSLEAGFENLSHFYHLFKNSFNITPAEFKKV